MIDHSRNNQLQIMMNTIQNTMNTTMCTTKRKVSIKIQNETKKNILFIFSNFVDATTTTTTMAPIINLYTTEYPQPPDEIPTEEDTTEIFQQPDNEIPTVPPTGTINVHVLPPTAIPTESHAIAYSCSENGKFYQEGEVWKVNSCKNCSCNDGRILCKVNKPCPTGN